MSTRSLSRSFLAALACTLLALPAMADSQARIVRLSDVHGSVQIDKNIGLGFENAFLNLPVAQGTKLKTLGDGRAEIEFEDGSTLRLAPNTTVEFSALGLSDSGKRISAVTLASGMAYVNWMGKDDFTLNFSHEEVALDRAAHFRVEESTAGANLAVFKGDVEVENPGGNVKVEKNKTASFDTDDKSTVANRIVSEPLDTWDKESITYHDQYAKNNVASPYGYGLSDLNYYGAYNNVPGYGMMWQPYFTGVGWDPFMDGAWGFYPGMGYMFASAYPWGWLPYRYGNWMFVPGFGWMWQPGAWSSYVAVPHYTATNLVTAHSLVAPTEGTKTVIVGKAGPASRLASSKINSGSAGLGIQRGSLSNLKDLNRQVAKSGFAEVRPAPQFAATSHANSGFGASERGGMAAESGGHSAPAAHPAAVGGTVRH